MIARSPLSHAIIRPTVLFGPESILINNIAWLLRRFPVFAVPGSGDYRLQPVFAGDVAELALAAAQKDADLLIDAAGPETFTFDGLVRLIAAKIGSRARIVHLAPGLALRFSRMAGEMVHDVLLTSDELEGLQAELLVAEGPPAGRTSFSEWLEQNAGKVGINYISELERHFR